MRSPEITAITLGVRDVERSRAFYVDGLGFRSVLDVPGEISFVQCAPGQLLALWVVTQMPAEYGDVAHGASAPPLSLGHTVAAVEEVQGCMPPRSQPGPRQSLPRPSASGAA